jgi:hypothetical protein
VADGEARRLYFDPCRMEPGLREAHQRGPYEQDGRTVVAVSTLSYPFPSHIPILAGPPRYPPAGGVEKDG